MTATEVNHKVVTSKEWLQARKAFLAKNGLHHHATSSAAAARLPWVKLEKQYVFDGPQGAVPLAELFQNRSQLIIYHFMFGPGWKQGCSSCSFVADHFDGMLVHLADRDVSGGGIAPPSEIEPFRNRMGWSFPWVSPPPAISTTTSRLLHPTGEESGTMYYNYAPSNSEHEAPGASVFTRTPPAIFHTYSTMRPRHTPGRVQLPRPGSEGTKRGRILPHPMAWVRHHDRYTVAPDIGPRGAGARVNCPCEAARSSSRRRTWRLFEAAGCVMPGAMILLLPKCPACLAAWLALATGVGLSVPAAGIVRTLLLLLSLAPLILLAVRPLLRAYMPRWKPRCARARSSHPSADGRSIADSLC